MSRTPIYGNSRAAYFEDGKYFDANGKEVSAADAGKTAEEVPAGKQGQARVLAPAGGQHDISGAAAVASTPASGPKEPVLEGSAEAKRVGVHHEGEPDPAAAARARKQEEAKRESRRVKLTKLTAKAVEKMVSDAGGTPATGAGARESNEKWLLDNVAD